jgi:hypothetical protein
MMEAQDCPLGAMIAVVISPLMANVVSMKIKAIQPIETAAVEESSATAQ